MIHKIFAEESVSLSDFKKNPLAVINEADGEIVAVLNRNQPVFYCFPPEAMEVFIELMQYRDEHARFFDALSK